MEVPRHADERLLDEILRPIRVTRLSGDEVDEAIPISVVETLERSRAAFEVCGHELFVREVLERAFGRNGAHVS